MTAVEAVAKAICCPDGCVNKQNGACLAAKLWFGKNATAAITAYKAAIREPTDEMALAAISLEFHSEDSKLKRDIIERKKRDFRAMIDKAE